MGRYFNTSPFLGGPTGTAGRGRSVLVLVVGLSGCASQLVDLSSPTTPYSLPVNQQLFAARVTPGSGRAIRGVVLSVEGMMTTMTSTGTNSWQASPFIPACKQVVPYKFLVQSEDAGGTGTAPLSEVFPSIGSFTRLITNQPAVCSTSPINADSVGFLVNTTADLVDAVPGDGFCSTTPDPQDPGSLCSLRAAIMEANHHPGLDLIVLPPNIYRLSLTGDEHDDTPTEAVGDLDITDSVAIESSFARTGCARDVSDFLDPQHNFADRGMTPSMAATIDAHGVDRVFDVYGSDTQVYLSCLHIMGGSVATADVTGTRRLGGGIMNRGVMVMRRVAVTDNVMQGVTAGVGLSNSGQASLQETAFFNNLGNPGGDAFGGTDGAAIYAGSGAVTDVEQSVFASNRAARGSAIENEQGTMTIVNSSFASNIPGAGEDLSATVYNNAGQVHISWSTLTAPTMGVLRSAGQLWIDNSLIATPLGLGPSPACNDGASHTAPNDPGAAGIVSAFGVRATDVNCIPRFYRDRWNNVVQPFLHGVDDQLLMTGSGFTPVVPIHRPSMYIGDTPVDQALPLAGCPSIDQRGAPRPNGGTGLCDPGAMELQDSEQ